MKIRTRFILTGIISVVILTVGCVGVAVGILQISGILRRTVQLDKLVNDLYILRSLTLEYVQEPSERVQEQWYLQFEHINANTAALSLATADVGEAFHNTRGIYDRIVEEDRFTYPVDQGTNLREGYRRQLFTALLTDTQRIIDWAAELSEREQGHLLEWVRFYSFGAIALMALTSLISGLMLVTSGRRIIRSLATIKEGAASIAHGDLERRIVIRGRDEFADLATAFNSMTSDLRRVYWEMAHTNRALRAIRGCDQILVRTASEEELLQGICDLIVKEGNYRFCRICLPRKKEGGTLNTVAWAGQEGGYLASLAAMESAGTLGREPAQTAFATGTSALFQNLDGQSPEPWVAEARARGYAAVIALPLMLDGEIEGSLAIYSADKDPFTEAETSLLEELASDIAYGIKAQRDRLERQRAEERVNRLASAVEQAADEIIIIDPRGMIQYVNPAFERSMGYDRREVEGHHVAIFRSQLQDTANYRRIVDDVREGGSWKGRLQIRRKDGQNIVQELGIAPIRNADGRITGFVLAGRDMTASVDMEARLAQSQKLEAIGTLAGGIAHDFNNILWAIIGYTELACMEVAPDTELQAHLQAVLKAADRAKDLVSQILTFSRRRVDEALQPVQVGLIVKEALHLVRASLPATIDILLDIQSAAMVMAHPTRIHQVLLNLCTNASLAMHDMDGTLEVELSSVDVDPAFAARHPGLEPGRFVQLRVSDTGCGMTPEVMEHIFEPFFTTRQEGVGTGMGLSVVHGIVTDLRGIVTVESEPGRGSTFRVFLPALAEDTLVREAPAETEPPGGDERILLVDDEPMMVTLAREVLEKAGYRVASAAGGPEALRIFEAAPTAVDLVISDMTMPRMTGDLLACRVKEIRPGLPVILISGYSERLTPENMAAAGINGFLAKPLSRIGLLRLVRDVLDRADHTRR